jgi:cobalamin biosynthesis protein CobD/CbiB
VPTAVPDITWTPERITYLMLIITGSIICGLASGVTACAIARRRKQQEEAAQDHEGERERLSVNDFI